MLGGLDGRVGAGVGDGWGNGVDGGCGRDAMVRGGGSRRFRSACVSMVSRVRYRFRSGFRLGPGPLFFGGFTNNERTRSRVNANQGPRHVSCASTTGKCKPCGVAIQTACDSR